MWRLLSDILKSNHTYLWLASAGRCKLSLDSIADPAWRLEYLYHFMFSGMTAQRISKCPPCIS